VHFIWRQSLHIGISGTVVLYSDIPTHMGFRRHLIPNKAFLLI